MNVNITPCPRRNIDSTHQSKSQLTISLERHQQAVNQIDQTTLKLVNMIRSPVCLAALGDIYSNNTAYRDDIS